MPRRKLAPLLAALAALAAALATPSVAGAAGDVKVDHNSPAGTEYDIPFEQAKRDLVPGAGKGSKGGSGGSGALFGEGISSAKGGRGAQGGANGGAAKGGAGAPGTPGAPGDSATAPGVAVLDDGGSSSLKWLLFGLLGLALVGGGGTLLLRRREAPLPPPFQNVADRVATIRDRLLPGVEGSGSAARMARAHGPRPDPLKGDMNLPDTGQAGYFAFVKRGGPSPGRRSERFRRGLKPEGE